MHRQLTQAAGAGDESNTVRKTSRPIRTTTSHHGMISRQASPAAWSGCRAGRRRDRDRTQIRDQSEGAGDLPVEVIADPRAHEHEQREPVAMVRIAQRKTGTPTRRRSMDKTLGMVQTRSAVPVATASRGHTRKPKRWAPKQHYPSTSHRRRETPYGVSASSISTWPPCASARAPSGRPIPDVIPAWVAEMDVRPPPRCARPRALPRLGRHRGIPPRRPTLCLRRLRPPALGLGGCAGTDSPGAGRDDGHPAAAVEGDRRGDSVVINDPVYRRSITSPGSPGQMVRAELTVDDRLDLQTTSRAGRRGYADRPASGIPAVQPTTDGHCPRCGRAVHPGAVGAPLRRHGDLG